MTKRDFELIAAIIKDFEPPFSEKNTTFADDIKQMKDTRHVLALEFATALGNVNKDFDRNKFLKACGVKDYMRSLG